jgi:hypothetical protein
VTAYPTEAGFHRRSAALVDKGLAEAAAQGKPTRRDERARIAAEGCPERRPIQQ